MTMRTRQRKLKQFEDALIEHKGNQTKAYMAIHPNASARTASSNAISLIKRNPQVMVNIAQRMDDNKGSEDMLCQKLIKLVNCKKSIVVDNTIHKVADNQTQLDSVKTALKLHGHLSTGVHISTDNRQVNISAESLDHRQLKSLSSKLTQLHATRKFDGDTQDGEVTDEDVSSHDDSGSITAEEEAEILAESDEGPGSEVDSGGTHPS